jgi:hypothetical protein
VKQIFAFLTLCLFLSTGCNQVTKVGGTVRFDDGTPVTTGYVYFDNGTESGRGEIKADGTYDMGMMQDGKGLPAGDYKVYVLGPTEESGPGIPLIAPEFTAADKTPLTCKVEAGKPVDFDIVVKHNPAVKKK